MKALNVDALLERNPKVDRDEVKKRERAGEHKQPQGSGSASPYRGKRMMVDDTLELDELAAVHYRAKRGGRE